MADDTTVQGLRGNDESTYANTVSQLAARCTDNNLELTVNKTMERVLDLWKHSPSHPPLLINNAAVWGSL